MSLAALEAALAAAPDDPLVLAAYADCLSDAGDPRGDFVRLQMAHDDPATPAADRRRLDRELRRLWLAHEPAWKTPAVRRLGQVGYYRLDGAVPLLRLRTLVPNAGEVLAASPVWWLLRGVRVDGFGDPFTLGRDLRDLFAALCRSRVRTLALHDLPAGDQAADDLIDTGLYPRLTALALPGCGVSDEGADRLAAHPHTPALRPLDLDRNNLSPVGFNALAAVGVHVSDRQFFLPGGWDYDPPAFPGEV